MNETDEFRSEIGQPCRAVYCTARSTHAVDYAGLPVPLSVLEEQQEGHLNYEFGPYCWEHAKKAAWAGSGGVTASLPVTLASPPLTAADLIAELHNALRPPAVVIKYKSSSQPRGQEGYEIAATSDATDADIECAVAAANAARLRIIAALSPSATEPSAGGEEA